MWELRVFYRWPRLYGWTSLAVPILRHREETRKRSQKHPCSYTPLAPTPTLLQIIFTSAFCPTWSISQHHPADRPASFLFFCFVFFFPRYILNSLESGSLISHVIWKWLTCLHSSARPPLMTQTAHTPVFSILAIPDENTGSQCVRVQTPVKP